MESICRSVFKSSSIISVASFSTSDISESVLEGGGPLLRLLRFRVILGTELLVELSLLILLTEVEPEPPTGPVLLLELALAPELVLAEVVEVLLDWEGSVLDRS